MNRGGRGSIGSKYYMEATGIQNIDLNSQFDSGPLWPPIHTSSSTEILPPPTSTAQFCGAPLPELPEVIQITNF